METLTYDPTSENNAEMPVDRSKMARNLAEMLTSYQPTDSSFESALMQGVATRNSREK